MRVNAVIPVKGKYWNAEGIYILTNCPESGGVPYRGLKQESPRMRSNLLH